MLTDDPVHTNKKKIFKNSNRWITGLVKDLVLFILGLRREISQYFAKLFATFFWYLGIFFRLLIKFF